MTPHLHRTHVEGCYRCDLSREEAADAIEEREEAYVKLVRHLVENDGDAPPWGATGLWVDLFDAATDEENAHG